jgi:hypothetical protein
MTDFTAEQLAAARDQIAGQTTGLGPPTAGVPDDQVAAQLAAGQAAAGQAMGGTVVDEDAIRAYIESMVRQQVTAALRAAGAEPPGEPLVNTAVSLRNLLKTHASMSPGTDHTAALGLADDLVEAAESAVKSGDVTYVGKIAARLVTWLERLGHPGPGDFHYHRQALDFAKYHIPDAAENVHPPVQSAGLLTSTKPPAKVLEGSVTG